MSSGFGDWKGPEKEEELDSLLELTERSLKEVKSLTEYEDQKAQRILAAVAFLAALAGALFTGVLKLLGDLGAGTVESSAWTVGFSIPAVALFFIYAFLVVYGSAIVLNAIRPTFKIPKRWDRNAKLPASFLFYEKIAELSKEEWEHVFMTHSVVELKLAYAKHSISEAHLVAQKIVDKVAELKKGVQILFYSTALLVVWIAVVAVFVGLTLGQTGAESSRARPPTPVDKGASLPSQSNAPTQNIHFAPQNYINCVHNDKTGAKIGSPPKKRPEKDETKAGACPDNRR